MISEIRAKSLFYSFIKKYCGHAYPDYILRIIKRRKSYIKKLKQLPKNHNFSIINMSVDMDLHYTSIACKCVNCNYTIYNRFNNKKEDNWYKPYLVRINCQRQQDLNTMRSALE